MHACKNFGFMSTWGNLFEMVEGLLLCVSCIEQYAGLLSWRPIKPV
jgi:hypothetical protein